MLHSNNKAYIHILSCFVFKQQPIETFPDSKVHGANMGPIWVLPAPDGPHVGLMNLAIRDNFSVASVALWQLYDYQISCEVALQNMGELIYCELLMYPQQNKAQHIL